MCALLDVYVYQYAYVYLYVYAYTNVYVHACFLYLGAVYAWLCGNWSRHIHQHVFSLCKIRYHVCIVNAQKTNQTRDEKRTMTNGSKHDLILPGDSALCATNPGWIHNRDNAGCYGNTAFAITTAITCLARLVIFFFKRYSPISFMLLQWYINKMGNVNFQVSTALGKGGTTIQNLAWPMAHHGRILLFLYTSLSRQSAMNKWLQYSN